MALSSSEAITRRGRGRGFEYFYPTGNKVGCARTLRRVQRLVIPPQWSHVLINTDATARVQAEGLDRQCRRQYIYHPQWVAQQQQRKFQGLIKFGEELPTFREFCWARVRADNWSLARSAALVCLLLDHTGLRAGNQQYTKANQTFGLTTLRRRHLQREDNTVTLNFTGKHGQQREVEIDDKRLADLVCASAEKQGYALFRYRCEGRWQDITSDDVNAFIHQYLGEKYSCKDFRTWSASRYAVHSLPAIHQILERNQRRKWSPTLTQHVAKMLGNTPQICRKYYLHPKLIETIEVPGERQGLISSVDEIMNGNGAQECSLTAIERLLMEVISKKSLTE